MYCGDDALMSQICKAISRLAELFESNPRAAFLRTEQADSFHHAVMFVQDFDGDAGNFEGYPCFRNILKMLDNQSIQGVMAGGELLSYFFYGGCKVDGFYAAPGDHDVLDHDALKIEQVEQNRLMLLRDEVACLEHEGTQFLR
jgi:hypothetical protein